jgi:short-subunit dehydrogenase
MITQSLQSPQNYADETDLAMAMRGFAGQKLVVVGGTSGMGRQTAGDVVAAGGSAVIIGRDADRVKDTVQTLAQDGSVYGITADLADRTEVDRVRQATGRRARRRHLAGQCRGAVHP